MANTETKTAPSEPASSDASDALASAIATKVEQKTASKSEPKSSPLLLVLNVLMGCIGLTMIVAFFLPWYQEAAELGVEVATHNGFALALESDLVGTPSALLFLVPVLGAALTAVSFLRLRFSPHIGIAIAVALLGYGLYVLLMMFVQHTAIGLWLVTGGTFVALLLAVAALVVARKEKSGEPLLSRGKK